MYIFSFITDSISTMRNVFLDLVWLGMIVRSPRSPACLERLSRHTQKALPVSNGRHVGRRAYLLQSFALCVGFGASFRNSWALDTSLLNYQYSQDWTGTSLTLLSVEEAAKQNQWQMGRWPDPILRRPADPVDQSLFATDTLKIACERLKETAQREGAVGLAAQQCGVNARIVFLDKVTLHPFALPSSMTLINPLITWRSPEIKMKVWMENCLVLPPTFAATVLRDASINIDYQTIDGAWKQLQLTGEAARCAQHELDHDRGILVTDHVDLDDLENDLMREIESEGHQRRMAIAIARRIEERHSI